MRITTGLLATVIVLLTALTGVLSWRLYTNERGRPGVVVAVRVISDPPGATLQSLSGANVLGTTPFTMQYGVPQQWTTCVSYEGLQARWPNGVALDVKRLELCPDGGTDQEIRLSAPRRPVTRRTPKVPPTLTPDLSTTAAQSSDDGPPPEPNPPKMTALAQPLSSPETNRLGSSPTHSSAAAATPLALPQTPTVRSIRPGSRVPVEVIARQASETGYSFVLPGYVSTQSNAYANCSGTERGSLDATSYGNTTYGTYRGTSYANCSGSSTATTTVSPPRQVSYAVSGATLSLRLPDGRVAVVNCDSKFNWTEWTFLPRRSCRVPTTNGFEAEFRADKAKLFWRVGISGEKETSETYRLLEIVSRAP